MNNPVFILLPGNNPIAVNNTYLLTPWCRVLANWFAASQEIPRILWNPKVHYRTHKRPPPVPILGQPNPVHIPTSHLLEIHPNIIHPSTSRSPQWSLSLRFPHQDPIRPLSSPIRATCPAISLIAVNNNNNNNNNNNYYMHLLLKRNHQCMIMKH